MAASSQAIPDSDRPFLAGQRPTSVEARDTAALRHTPSESVNCENERVCRAARSAIASSTDIAIDATPMTMSPRSGERQPLRMGRSSAPPTIKGRVPTVILTC